jgi:hypothetical protein
MAAFRPRVWATGLRVVEGDSIDGIWNLMYLIRGLWKNGTPRLYRLESQPPTRHGGITGLVVRMLVLSRKTVGFQRYPSSGSSPEVFAGPRPSCRIRSDQKPSPRRRIRDGSPDQGKPIIIFRSSSHSFRWIADKLRRMVRAGFSLSTGTESQHRLSL